MENFNITITSSTECVFKDTNRQSKFRAHLGRTLELRGNWKVALLELFYPITYGNLSSQDLQIISNSISSTKVFLPRAGFYSDAHCLVKELNRVMYGHFQLQLSPSGFVTLKFETEAMFQNYTIPFTLQDILGFERFPPILGIGEIQARFPCDPRRGFPKLFSVETDIIREQCVNNGHRKSLRSFTPSADSSSYGLSAAKSFEKLLFLPVSKNSLESIDFLITDEHQKEVTFAYGTLSAVLVFKRCGYGF
jgi:hypothetical protein